MPWELPRRRAAVAEQFHYIALERRPVAAIRHSAARTNDNTRSLDAVYEQRVAQELAKLT